MRRQGDGCKAEGQRMGWEDELRERQRVREEFQTRRCSAGDCSAEANVSPLLWISHSPH